MPDLVPTDPAPLGRPKRVRPDRTHITRGVIRAALFVALAYGTIVGFHALVVQTVGHMNADMATGALYGLFAGLGLAYLGTLLSKR